MTTPRTENVRHTIEHGTYDFSPTHEGTEFESLVEAFSSSYGAFEASPSCHVRRFAWATDFRSSGVLTTEHSVFESPWRFRTLSETPEHLTLYAPQTGSVRLTFGNRVVAGAPGQLLMANNHQVGDHFTEGEPHCSDFLFLDWKVVKRTLVSLLETPIMESLDLNPIIDVTTPSGQLISNLARTIIHGMRNDGPLLASPLSISTLSETLANLVLRFTQHSLTQRLEKKVSMIAPWYVRRAIDYMHANVGEPFTIVMVADTVGVSLRALQSGFKAFRGTSPGGYLRTIRLQAARDQLSDPSNQQTVREVCARWGFFHPGRFSMVYFRAFGENPKDTRVRAATL